MREHTGKNIKCEFCNKEKYIPGWRLGIARYCSRACQYASKKRVERIIAKQSAKIFKKCITCDASFLITPSRKDVRLNCSKSCYYKSEEFKTRFSGENNFNWKGGVTPLNQKIRKSLRYKKWRNAVFARDGYKCIWCGRKGDINADHIKPFAYFPELRFDITNGRTLCVPCHKMTPTYAMRLKIKI